jgi:hypothetical protein
MSSPTENQRTLSSRFYQEGTQLINCLNHMISLNPKTAFGTMGGSGVGRDQNGVEKKSIGEAQAMNSSS